MEGMGAAVAIAAAALVGVYILNRRRQAETAMLVGQITAKAKPSETLTFEQIFRGGGTVVATYFGGPGAGASFFEASGK